MRDKLGNVVKVGSSVACWHAEGEMPTVATAVVDRITSEHVVISQDRRGVKREYPVPIHEFKGFDWVVIEPGVSDAGS